MKNDNAVKEIIALAKKDEVNRKDPRYLMVMGLLTAKGFLAANRIFPAVRKRRLKIDDAVWAGKYVEPRILEVLPAAIVRLPKYFEPIPAQHADLSAMVERLKAGKDDGPELWGIPYGKIKVWNDFPFYQEHIKRNARKRHNSTFGKIK